MAACCQARRWAHSAVRVRLSAGATRAKQRPNGSAFEAYVNGDVPALVHLGTVPNKRDPLACLQRAPSLADDPTEVDEENLAVGC